MAQLFANCSLPRVRFVQVFAICNLLRVRCGWVAGVCDVCDIKRLFFRKFLIRVHEKVSQKTLKNVANVASKKLQIQRRAAHAENGGGE